LNPAYETPLFPTRFFSGSYAVRTQVISTVRKLTAVRFVKIVFAKNLARSYFFIEQHFFIAAVAFSARAVIAAVS